MDYGAHRDGARRHESARRETVEVDDMGSTGVWRVNGSRGRAQARAPGAGEEGESTAGDDDTA